MRKEKQHTILAKAKNVFLDRNLDEAHANGLWDYSIELNNNIQNEKQETIYNKLWDRVDNILENILEVNLLYKRLSFNDIEKIIQDATGFKISLSETYFEQGQETDRSLIGGLGNLHFSDWYPYDVEIYFLETNGYNLENEKTYFITEIVVMEN